MNRNLEAQKQNLNSKQTLLSHNVQQFGNLRDAMNMTRIQQNDMLAHQLGAAAANAAGPMAKAAALQAKGQILQQNAPLMMQLSMNRTMMHLANQANAGGPGTGNPTAAIEAALPMMRQRMPEQAKEWESRLVPGVGVGTVPIPESARGQMVATKNVNDLFNRSLMMAQQPIPTNPAQYAKYKAMADTVQQQLIGSIKQAQHDGVYKESEAEFLLKQIGDSPASMFRAFSSVPKIKELQQIKQQEYTNLLGQFGIRGQCLQQAPEAPQYKTVNGIKYMRGPNGQAIPVK